jgi:cytochrome c biogenesis protein
MREKRGTVTKQNESRPEEQAEAEQQQDFFESPLWVWLIYYLSFGAMALFALGTYRLVEGGRDPLSWAIFGVGIAGFALFAALDYLAGKGFAFEKVWKSLSSVHLAVILLLLLAGISIIGTILAQGDSAQDNIQLFENMIVSLFDLFGIVDAENQASLNAQHDRIHRAAERLYLFSERASFTRLYHAWYFYVLLALFSLNLIVCSVKRWSLTWRMIAGNELPVEEGSVKSKQARREIALRSSLTDAAAAVEASMRKGGYSPRRAESEGAVSFFGQRGAWSRFGVYITHSSILVILAGGIVGVTQGFKGYMQITEGTSESRFYDRRSKTTKILPFQVRCENFQVDYYGNSRRPKDYFSDLVVIQDGEEKMKKRIEVNAPLVYDDIWFYQSSYGETGQDAKATLRVAASPEDEGVVEKFTTVPREFPDLGVTVRVIQVLPDFATDQNQRPYSKSNQPNNPAALIEVTGEDGVARRSWLFQRFSEANTSKGLPATVTFLDFGGVQYTGLQVVYDPGVWVIWVGCTLMVIGLYVAFFTSHRRVWVRVEEKEGKVKVMLGGNANKNRDGFAESFQRLGDAIDPGTAGVSEA